MLMSQKCNVSLQECVAGWLAESVTLTLNVAARPLLVRRILLRLTCLMDDDLQCKSEPFSSLYQPSLREPPMSSKLIVIHAYAI